MNIPTTIKERCPPSVGQAAVIYLVVVLTVAVTCLPAIAQENDQSIFVVRSRDVGDAPPDLVQLCIDKAAEVPIPGIVVMPPFHSMPSSGLSIPAAKTA